MKLKLYIFALSVIVALTAAATPPSAFHAALKKLYPLATDVGWSQQGNDYTATFVQNGFEKTVWMNANAQWIMTATDIQTADQLTPGAYNAFMFGPYAQWTVVDVDFVEFPKRPAVYVVKVNQDNSISTYQLFYTQNGQLLQTRDISYTGGTLTPSAFNFL